MKKLVAALSLATAVGLMAAPTPAAAAVNVVVTPPGAAVTGVYAPPNVVLSQGAPAYFLQLDPTIGHDIFECPQTNCSSSYLKNQSKFFSPQGALLGAHPIQFRGNVTPGTYRFYCTLHPNMVGTATVV